MNRGGLDSIKLHGIYLFHGLMLHEGPILQDAAGAPMSLYDRSGPSGRSTGVS